MKDSLYKKLFRETKSKSSKQVIQEMIARNMCDHKRIGKHGNEKKNWDEETKTVDGELKTYARCLNPHCQAHKKPICLDLLDTEEIKEHADYMIDVFNLLMINNKNSDEDFLQLMAIIKTYLQMSPDMYQAHILNRLDENGIDPDEDMDETGPRFIQSDKSWGFDDKKKKNKNWKKKKDKDKKKKNHKKRKW